jgi:hypothetical protein
LKSSRFNTKPPSQNSPSYALNKIKPAFRRLLLKQKEALRNFLNVPIRRENPEGDRHYCDSCFTGLFNYHFVCSTCASEICPDCYDKLTTTSSNDILLACTEGNKHLKEEFVLVSKLTEDSVNHLIQTTAPESAISDNEQYINANNEMSYNDDSTNSKYNNQTENQHSSSSDVECNHTFSSADTQCTNNNEKSIITNLSTGTII